jgi:predicted nucleic acid-binding protein
LTGIVVDASVALAWCFSDETSAEADIVLLALEGRTALVPAVWPLEVTNAISAAERRKRITRQDVIRFLDLLEALTIRQDSLSISASVTAILPLTRAHGLSAYDAAYLELAIRHSVPLATLDLRLEEAARRAGVEILPPRRPPKAKR